MPVTLQPPPSLASASAGRQAAGPSCSGPGRGQAAVSTIKCYSESLGLPAAVCATRGAGTSCRRGTEEEASAGRLPGRAGAAPSLPSTRARLSAVSLLIYISVSLLCLVCLSRTLRPCRLAPPEPPPHMTAGCEGAASLAMPPPQTPTSLRPCPPAQALHRGLPSCSHSGANTPARRPAPSCVSGLKRAPFRPPPSHPLSSAFHAWVFSFKDGHVFEPAPHSESIGGCNPSSPPPTHTLE